MNKDIIRTKFNDLYLDIENNYNKIKIIDNYDFYRSNPYTIFYLNKKESFDKFKDKWNENIDYAKEYDEYCYDDILYRFEEYNKDNFDYIELGTLDVPTYSEYELFI